MSEANKALVRRVIEEGLNKHNLALLDELYADCVWYRPATGELKGEALKQFVASMLAAFPDIRFTIEDQVAEGDKVVTRWTFTGTHQGEFMGLAPTGKQVTTSGIDICRIVEGKIVEEREEWDTRASCSNSVRCRRSARPKTRPARKRERGVAGHSLDAVGSWTVPSLTRPRPKARAPGFGVCTDSHREVIPCGGKGAAIGAVMFAPMGAAVGALMPTGGWHDVYRAR